MVDLRNALLEARLDSRERATSVKLGTRYQSRTLAVNPPPATGTLQSTPQANFSVTDGDGEEELNLTGNQFIEYTPSYSEYRDAGTIRYENSLVYHDFADANVALSSQRLVRNGDILLIPNKPSINEQGIDRVTYEPTPSELRVVTIDNPTIKIPTELDEEDWERLLSDEDDVINNISVDPSENGDILTVEFDGERRIFFTPLPEQSGLGDEPEDPPGCDDEGININPAGPDDIILIGADLSNRGTATLTFSNLEGENSFVAGRIPFYFGGPGGGGGGNNGNDNNRGGGGAPDAATSITSGGDEYMTEDAEWPVGGNFKALSNTTNNPIVIEEGETEIVIEFNNNLRANQDFFVLTFELQTGERATYFVWTMEE